MKLNKKLKNTKAENVVNYEVINDYELDREKIFEVDNVEQEDIENEKRIFIADRNKKGL